MRKLVKSIIALATAVYLAITVFMVKVQLNIRTATGRTRHILALNSGENFVESALKILIAVVIGALLLAGLYLLFNGTVLPTLTQRVKDLFNYGG